MVDLIITMRSSLRDRLIALIIFVAVLLGIGTFVFHFVEKWGWIDSFYVSSISLTTRGYGELHPLTSFGKIFMVLYLFIGVAIILYLLSSFISYYMQNYEPAVVRGVSSTINKIADSRKKKEEDRWVTLSTPVEKQK